MVRLRQTETESVRLFVVVSAADPLNLVGIVTPGRQVAATARNRLLYRDGLPVAVKSAAISNG